VNGGHIPAGEDTSRGNKNLFDAVAGVLTSHLLNKYEYSYNGDIPAGEDTSRGRQMN